MRRARPAPATAVAAAVPAAAAAARLHVSAMVLGEVRKPDVKNIKVVRERVPGTSLTKAREALLASRPDPEAADSVDAAIAWLEKDRQASGAAKAQKLDARSANEGAIALAVLNDGWNFVPGTSPPARAPATAAIVELACETDFVAKNPLFQTLARDLVHSAAQFPLIAGDAGPGQGGLQDIDLDMFSTLPVLPSHPGAPAPKAPTTVQQAIVDVVARLGENIKVRRAAAFYPTAGAELEVTAAYAHNAFSEPESEHTVSDATKEAHKQIGYNVTVGKVGALILSELRDAPKNVIPEDLTKQLRSLGRSLARQAAGMPTSSLAGASAPLAAQVPPNETSEALLEQPFLMLLGSAMPSGATGIDNAQSVHDALAAWSQATNMATKATGLRRWTVGETTAEDTEDPADFAAEVRKAAGI